MTCFIAQIGTPPLGISLKQSLNHKNQYSLNNLHTKITHTINDSYCKTREI